MSKILLMVFLSSSLINNPRRVHLLMKVIALSLGFYALKGGVFFVENQGQFMFWGPEMSFLSANNAIGLAVAMNAPLLFYLAKIEPKFYLRFLMRAMFWFSFPAVLCTYSRGAWLALGASTAFSVLKSKHKVPLMILAVTLTIGVFPFIPERVSNRYQDLVNYQEESSAQSRFWNWEFATRVALAHPYLGAGFNYYSLEAYQRYFPEFQEVWTGKVWSCHSSWFTMLSEHGFLAFGLFIALWITVFGSLRRINRRARDHPEFSWMSPYAVMLQGAFIGYFVAASFLDASYFDLVYQLIIVVVILKEIIARSLTDKEKMNMPAVVGATVQASPAA